ncbi:MAG: carboxylate-amine ligase [Candidatus Promineifilaceae bacterium]
MGSAPPLTLGIEEEYQIIDPETRNLSANIEKLLRQDEERGKSADLRPEFLQSQVEIGSKVCQNVQEIRSELVRLRREVCSIARDNNLRIAAASSHPFAKWEEQDITNGVRYKEMLDNMQGVARQLLIFGCHVHVGFGHHENPDNRELMIDVMNQARYFIPHILALSTSSPFWHGKKTGLKSYRSVIFEMLPRTGIPPRFASWSDFASYEKTMAQVGSFGKDDPVAKIWWDIRPHPKFDTLEFRITDICTKVDEAVCIAALFQAICAKLLKLRRQNMSWRTYGNLFVSENKWRAVRFGTSETMIDFGRSQEIPYRQLMEELLELVDDVLDELNCRKEVEYIHTILDEGTSADRQLRVYEQHGGDANSAEALKAVVDHLIIETELGL